MWSVTWIKRKEGLNIMNLIAVNILTMEIFHGVTIILL